MLNNYLQILLVHVVYYAQEQNKQVSCKGGLQFEFIVHVDKSMASVLVAILDILCNLVKLLLSLFKVHNVLTDFKLGFKVAM